MKHYCKNGQNDSPAQIGLEHNTCSTVQIAADPTLQSDICRISVRRCLKVRQRQFVLLREGKV